MKQLFHIEHHVTFNGPRSLSLRIGEKHACFAITDRSGSELHKLAYYVIDDPGIVSWNENELAAFESASSELNDPFDQVLVAYDFPQSVMMASAIYDQEDAALLLQTTGAMDKKFGADLLEDRQLYNIYSVGGEAGDWVRQKFPAAGSTHQYSAGLKKIAGMISGESLVIDFRTYDFTVLAIRENQLLFAQTFAYSTPEDVLYYLLNTCRQFKLSQQELQLQLSGLIDKRSSLYNELYQYFIHIDFREAGWNLQNGYPAHFFTSLNDLATCAS